MATLFLKSHRVTFISVSLFIFSFVLLSLWCLATPFNHGPDENTHFLLIKWIAEHFRLPVLNVNFPVPRSGDGIVIDPYVTHPPLYYVLSAVFALITGVQDRVLMRIPQLITGALLTPVIFLTVLRAKIGDFRDAVLIALIIFCIPQLTFISAYLNNDAIAVLSVALIMLSLVNFSASPSVLRSILVGTAFALGCYSKYTAYPAIFLLGCYFGIECARKLSRAEAMKAVIISTLAGLALLIPWLVFNLRHYQNLLPIFHTAELFKQLRNEAGLQTLHESGNGLQYLLNDTNWLRLTFRSFYGVFGGLNYHMPKYFYKYFNYVFGSLVCCAVFFLISSRIKKRIEWPEVLQQVIIMLVFPLTIAFSMYASLTKDFQPQGRYLLPAIAPAAFFIFSNIKQGKWRVKILFFAGIMAVTLNIFALVSWWNKVSY